MVRSHGEAQEHLTGATPSSFAPFKCGLTPRSSGDPLRQPPLGRSRSWCKLSFRGQAASASTVALARTLGSTNETVRCSSKVSAFGVNETAMRQQREADDQSSEWLAPIQKAKLLSINAAPHQAEENYFGAAVPSRQSVPTASAGRQSSSSGFAAGTVSARRSAREHPRKKVALSSSSARSGKYRGPSTNQNCRPLTRRRGRKVQCCLTPRSSGDPLRQPPSGRSRSSGYHPSAASRRLPPRSP